MKLKLISDHGLLKLNNISTKSMVKLINPHHSFFTEYYVDNNKNQELLVFTSCAKLLYLDGKNWIIRSYYQDMSDGYSAFEQLKMYDACNQMNRYYQAMRQHMNIRGFKPIEAPKI